MEETLVLVLLVVLQCKHGDVIVYNLTHPHGTTEFDLHPNEPESGTIFLAFFHEKECTPCRPIVTGYGKQVGCAATHTSFN